MSRVLSLDLFDIESHLTEEERMARAAVARFVDADVLPVITEHFRAGTFPDKLIPTLADLGMLGANLQGYGCAGMSHTGYGICLLELERGDSGIRSFASVQGSLVMYPILTFGSEAQKDRWLPQMAAGKAIGCFGLTEPDYGSDPGGMLTRAVQQKDGSWVLNGSKRWITNGTICNVAVVWAKTGEGADSIRGFLVERGTPGFEVKEVTGKWSLRASYTAELYFDDVKLPADAILPKSTGLKSALMCLNNARAGIAFGALGSAMATFECARRYSMERKQFGRPIGSFQLVQEKLVEMYTGIQAGLLMSLHLMRLKEAGKATHAHVSMCKRHNVAVARKCAITARELLGANGICDDYPIVRHLLNIESVYTYEGTHDIHTLILGRELTGQNAFGG
ncbi:MAG: acyl-CoA dehydrogenase family protein [Myxococcota bacterium]